MWSSVDEAVDWWSVGAYLILILFRLETFSPHHSQIKTFSCSYVDTAMCKKSTNGWSSSFFENRRKNTYKIHLYSINNVFFIPQKHNLDFFLLETWCLFKCLDSRKIFERVRWLGCMKFLIEIFLIRRFWIFFIEGR